MTLTEAATVKNLVRDLLCDGVTHHTDVGPGLTRGASKYVGLDGHFLAASNLLGQSHGVFEQPKHAR